MKKSNRGFINYSLIRWYCEIIDSFSLRVIPLNPHITSQYEYLITNYSCLTLLIKMPLAEYFIVFPLVIFVHFIADVFQINGFR